MFQRQLLRPQLRLRLRQHVGYCFYILLVMVDANCILYHSTLIIDYSTQFLFDLFFLINQFFSPWVVDPTESLSSLNVTVISTGILTDNYYEHNVVFNRIKWQATHSLFVTYSYTDIFLVASCRLLNPDVKLIAFK